MTLENAYFISQLVAVAAVIASLLYLAVQVKQNTAQAQASARYQWVEATGQMNAVMVGNKATASIFRRGLKGADHLDEDEHTQFTVLIGHYFQIYSTMFELHQDQLLPESQWHNVRKDILALMSSTGGRNVWDAVMKNALHPKFVAFVEAMDADDEISYDTSAF